MDNDLNRLKYFQQRLTFLGKRAYLPLIESPCIYTVINTGSRYTYTIVCVILHELLFLRVTSPYYYIVIYFLCVEIWLGGLSTACQLAFDAVKYMIIIIIMIVIITL